MRRNYYLFYKGMKLITSTQARDLLRVDNKPINWRTFMRLTKEKKVKPELTTPQGTQLYDEEKVRNLRAFLPKSRKPGAPYF